MTGVKMIVKISHSESGTYGYIGQSPMHVKVTIFKVIDKQLSKCQVTVTVTLIEKYVRVTGVRVIMADVRLIVLLSHSDSCQCKT